MFQIQFVHSALILVRHIAIPERIRQLTGFHLRNEQTPNRVKLPGYAIGVQRMSMFGTARVPDDLDAFAGCIMMRTPVQYPDLIHVWNVVKVNGIAIGGDHFNDDHLKCRQDKDTVQCGLTDEDQMWSNSDGSTPNTCDGVFAAKRFIGARNKIMSVDAMMHSTR